MSTWHKVNYVESNLLCHSGYQCVIDDLLCNRKMNLYMCVCVYTYIIFAHIFINVCLSQWPRGLMRRSAAARPLRSWVRIPPEAWMFVCCECCVLSGRGLCDELITHPEDSYRLCCVVVCDLETSRMGAPYIYMTLVA